MSTSSAPLLIQAIGLANASSLSRLTALAFGDQQYSIEPCESLSQAAERKHANASDRILILHRPAQKLAFEAKRVVDEENLPLWAVIACGMNPPTPEIVSIPPGAQASESNATILRLSLENHRAARLCERCRGDLLTIATRICHDLRTVLSTVQTALFLQSDPDLPPEEDTKEIADIALRSLSSHDNIVSKLSSVTEATAKPFTRGPVSVDHAYYQAADLCRPRIEEREGSITPSVDWSEQAFGVQSWVNLIWTNMIDVLLSYRHCSNDLTVGCDESSGDLLVFWIQAKTTPDPEQESALQTVPFNRLHLRQDGSNIQLSIIQRLALLQDGNSGVETQNGHTRIFFTLPRLK